MSDDADGAVTTVTPEQLEGILRAGEPVTVLDIRDLDEFERWRITGGEATPVQGSHAKFVQAQILGNVADYAADRGVDPDDNVVVVCPHGEASRRVAGMLSDAGVDAGNLEGGLAAWASHLAAEPVPNDTATVLQYRRPATGCLSYLVASGRDAVVIDPLRAFAGRYAGDAVALGVELSHVVDTHVHADHLSGARQVAERAGATLVMPEGVRERGLADDVEAELLADGDQLPFGNLAAEAVALPGHTGEMTGLRVGDLLFCGDSVFLDGVARPDLERGAEGAPALARTLHETLTGRLDVLPGSITLLPGHYGDPAEAPRGPYATSLAEVRERVGAFGMSESEFVEFVTADLPPRPANFERIRDANLGLVDVDDDEAFELELGPNNCAVR